ncbi:hypothetical protein NP544_12640 [Pseudomonas monteilii]|uniref:hypothetical protein n=1 Tax=Pseudomonas monteilii TaxID=76759 RepID=UPI000302F241|nr:hypothetical protein [Pseudomonas monteilii]MDD2124389.1 hypothetical protein [Pseudomonas monteilii]
MKSLYRAADAHPIKTQERWRRDILRALELEVEAALVEAQHILDHEGHWVANVG